MPAMPIMGQIMPFAGTIVPRGWAMCNGALMAISTNSALFSLLGTTYGGDGMRTFALPDLRGRAILGSSGTGGSYPAGMISGSARVTLNVSNLPSHNHAVQVSTVAGAVGRPIPVTGKIFGTNTIPANAPKMIFGEAGKSEVPLSVGTNILNDGGNQAHNNMQPYLVINYLISLQGVFPSRP